MTAFYPILNSAPDIDGYFEIPGKLSGMFVSGFDFVAVDNYGSPITSAGTTFRTVSSVVSGGNTRVTPSYGSPLSPGIPPATGTWVTLIGGGYNINYSDSTLGSIFIPVGSFDGTTSLNLPGRAVFNYGEVIAQNFLKLLENFASPTQPINPTQGQLWFDKSGSPPLNAIKVYDGSSFVPLTASGLLLENISDVNNNVTSGASIGDVLTWTGVDWDSQSPGVDNGVNFDYVVAGGTQIINTTNVTTTSATGTTAYQQVFRNGILQMEIFGSPTIGTYTVTGSNQITFDGSLNNGDQIAIYQL